VVDISFLKLRFAPHCGGEGGGWHENSGGRDTGSAKGKRGKKQQLKNLFRIQGRVWWLAVKVIAKITPRGHARTDSIRRRRWQAWGGGTYFFLIKRRAGY